MIEVHTSNELGRRDDVTRFAYRSDIDGLRGLAVAFVALYHAGVRHFTGGYVGVDVFFVISGFLITSIVVQDVAEQRFDYRRFLLRRARRIFPALLVVVAASLVAGYALLLPNDFRDLGRSALSMSAFSSNFYFWLKADYFDTPAHTKPLLHTWSLSVEEQFYLLLPPLLLLVVPRGKRALVIAASALGLISLGVAQWLSEGDRGAAFFLLHSRGWELLVGVALSTVIRGRFIPRLWSAAVSIAGLLLISIPAMTYSDSTPFPGWLAGPPVLGAALLIAAGPRSAVARGLSVPVLVNLGLVSYSFYLWHWPILVFTRYVSRDALPTGIAAAALVIALLCAGLSYHFVELPIRRRRLLVGNGLFAMAMFVAFASIAAAGGVIDRSLGAPGRLEPRVRAVYEKASALPAFTCVVPTFGIDHLCGAFRNGAPPSIIVWGDSHAVMLMPMLETRLRQASISWALYQCAPVLRVYRVDQSASIQDAPCTHSNDEMVDYIARNDVRHVLLASYWTQYTEGIELRMEGAGSRHPFYADETTRSDSARTARAVFDRQFRRTVTTLRGAGAAVWVVKQVPTFKYWVANEASKALVFGDNFNGLTRPYAEYERRTRYVNALFDELNARGDVSLIEPSRALCADGVCHATFQDQVLYRDFSHLTAAGVGLIAPVFQPLISSLIGDKEPVSQAAVP